MYRPVLEWFKERMDRKLAVERNVGKGHWGNDPQGALLHSLRKEVNELDEALNVVENYENVINECADIANFAMMIADNANERRRPSTRMVDPDRVRYPEPRVVDNDR